MPFFADPQLDVGLRTCAFRRRRFRFSDSLRSRPSPLSPGPKCLLMSRTIQIVIQPCLHGNRASVPGLVNAHSHSFQRAMRARAEHHTAATADTFWTWRDAMYRVANRLSPEDIYHVARMAFLEMLLSGITTVGEFHYLHNAGDGSRYDDPNLLALQIIRAAQEVGLRIVLLRSAYARAGWRQPANPLQARFFMREYRHIFRRHGSAHCDRNRADWSSPPQRARAAPRPYHSNCAIRTRETAARSYARRRATCRDPTMPG